MIVSEKMKIFISDKIKNDSELYKAIEQGICKDIKCCQIIRNKEFLKSHKDKYSKVRFGCVTPDTNASCIDRLLTNSIPTVFFGPDDKKLYEDLLESHGILKDRLNEMIYNMEHKEPISGAIRWVHNYYYYLRKKKEGEENNSRKEKGNKEKMINELEKIIIDELLKELMKSIKKPNQ